MVPGKMMIHDNGGLVNPRYIINFPTKRHWRGKSRIVDVRSGLDALVEAGMDAGQMRADVFAYAPRS